MIRHPVMAALLAAAITAGCGSLPNERAGAAVANGADCAGMPHDLVKDFPALTVTTHIVSSHELQIQCIEALSIAQMLARDKILGCAHVNLMHKRCDIYIPAAASACTREHEQMHCRGYDHDGILRAKVEAWNVKSRGASPEGAASSLDVGLGRAALERMSDDGKQHSKQVETLVARRRPSVARGRTERRNVAGGRVRT